MPRKIVSGNIWTDTKRLFGWIGSKAKGKTKGFWHRIFEAMNR